MLKKIILRGFKSFADEVIVDFSNGVTAIIGPNGTGKSNISDGIKWVLGEQSAKNLRSSKLDDVIFAGAEGRKPGGFAEVCLFLDNSTGFFKKSSSQEISVSRKTYRGGKSEFFINGEQTLLRDIHELFLDSGIGSNSYSIISQGQIEKILSTKKEDRRSIFEEAAGIVKLKHNKENTEKKLKEVELDQERISDILHEVNKQLQPLKRQAEKALKFKEFKNELEKLEINFIANEIKRIDKDSDSLSSDEIEFEASIQSQQRVRQTKQDSLNALKQSSQSNDEELFLLQESSAHFKETIEQTKSEIALRNERIQNANDKINEYQSSLKERESNLNFSLEEFQNKKSKYEENKLYLKRVEEQLNQQNNVLSNLETETTLLEESIESNRQKSIDLYNENSKSKMEIEQKKERVQELENRLALFLTDKKQQEKELESLTYKLNDLNQKRSELEQTVVNNVKKISSYKDSMASSTEKIEGLIQQFQNKKELFIQSSSKLENLLSITENLEDLYPGVRAILKANRDNKINGIYGNVAELVQTKDGYETAIGNLILPYEQFIVVENDTVVQACIDYLNTNKLGTATFIPLNMLSPATFSDKENNIIEQFKGIEKALDFIYSDKKFTKLMTFLVGRSLVSNTLQNGISFFKSNKKFNARISTHKGETLRPGTISGGTSSKKKSNRLEKKKELSSLESTCRSLKKEMFSLESTINKEQNNLKKLKVNLFETEESNRSLQKSLISLDKNIESLKFELNSYNDKIENNDNEINQFNKNMSFLNQDIEEGTCQLDQGEKTYYEIYNQLQSNVEKLKINKELLLQHQEAKNNLLLNLTKTQQENDSLQSYLDEMGNGNDSVHQYIEQIESNIQREKNSIVSFHSELSEFEKDKNTQLKKLMEVEAKITQLRKQIAEARRSQDSIEKEIHILNQSIHKSENGLNTLKIKKGKKETERENFLQRLSDEYKLTYDEIDVSSISPVNLEDKQRISKLKKNMSDLGNINHAAIEDSKSLEDRYKKEKEQYDDTKRAKDDLVVLLNEIESQMKTRFLESFQVISENFISIFTELFGGGVSKLKLEDPHHPLTSAVEIIAQPPGKKMQNINSLSGGEKALTAASIIFAIIQAKPSPFIILDEVDAPLDEANVFRYAYFLKKMSKNNQFIVVTHRKGSMMVSDFVYGVTQVQNGVSTIFPHCLDVQELSSS